MCGVASNCLQERGPYYPRGPSCPRLPYTGIRQVKTATCTASATRDVIIHPEGIPVLPFWRVKPGLHFERKSTAHTQTILRTWGAFSRPPMTIYAVCMDRSGAECKHSYIREVKIVTCTASATCDVMVREAGIQTCRCERVHLTFSTPSAPSTRSTGTAGENM